MNRTRIMLVAVVGTACTLSEQTPPSLVGPSTLAMSMSLSAVPDTLVQNGVSRSQITLVARDAAGRPLVNLAVSVDVEDVDQAADGASLDPGRLSARVISTDADGRAVVSYTAPRASRLNRADRIVAVVFTPVGTDFGAAVPRKVRIRLRPV